MDDLVDSALDDFLPADLGGAVWAAGVGSQESAESIAPSPNSQPPADAIRGVYERESYAWALDTFFVYENLGTSAKAAKKFSDARQALLKHAKADMANFMGQLLPKAMQLLERASEKHGDADSIVTEEKKGIAELKRILTAAIEEAKGAP